MVSLFSSLLIIIVLSAISQSLFPAVNCQQQQQITSSSPSLLFQLQVKTIPKVPFSSYYGATASVNSYCQPFGGLWLDGEVQSFEQARRDIAAAAALPESWITVFPTDGLIGRFLVLESDGYDASASTAAPSAASSTTSTSTSTSTTTSTTTTTTSTTTTTTMTATNTTTLDPNATTTALTAAATTTTVLTSTTAPTTPAPRFARDGTNVQIFAVWILVKMTNSTNPIPTLQRESANQQLLRLSTNVGDSAALAATPSLRNDVFFALNAVDFGYEVSTAPMRAQKDQKMQYWLGVYNDEWDRFLIGMIAVTIMGCAAYITAHCFIHRVPPRGALVSADKDVEGKSSKDNSQSNFGHQQHLHPTGAGDDDDDDMMKTDG